MFWRLTGTVPLDGEANLDDGVLDRLSALLERQKKSVAQDGSRLTFDDSFWCQPLGAEWHTMWVFKEGEFWIDREERTLLKYDLRSLHFLFLSAGFAVIAMIVRTISHSFAQGTAVGAIMFVLFYGANMLLAIPRARLLIEKAARRG